MDGHLPHMDSQRESLNGGYAMPMSAPPMMSQNPNLPQQQQQMYNGPYDGLPNMNMGGPPDMAQQGAIYGDATLMDESIEAKRRRIARVRAVPFLHLVW